MTRTEPTYEESAKLFAKYQMAVHKDDELECNELSFYNFLVKTPLEYKTCQSGPPQGYGSFHQQYWLDGKLLAVGVIDILPKCVSSVYFFYDPDYRNLTLGTYGSLRELQFTRELHKASPDLQYYYMGYYIHSCPKMRYKANLSPSFLLCPETYEWFPIERCLPKLDQYQYCRLNPDLYATDRHACTSADIDEMLVLFNYTCIPYKIYKMKYGPADKNFKHFAFLVGKKCIRRLIVFLSIDDD